jgi:hypothetical protein
MNNLVLKYRAFYITLLILTLYSIVDCKAQQSTIEYISTASPSNTPSALKVIFDDSRSQLIGIDKTGAILDSAVISFQLSTRIQGASYSEETKGCFLNNAMLELLKKADVNSIIYFEHIQAKDASGHVGDAANFQFNIGYSYKKNTACVGCPLVAANLEYKRLRCGLYTNSIGDICYQTEQVYNENFDHRTAYITWIYNIDKNDSINGGLKEMKFVIDTATFRFISAFYWADKNNVYHFTPMSDGGTVCLIDEADSKTFTPIGEDGYSKDKTNAYYRGQIMEGVDVKTINLFKTRENIEFAYDKSHIYEYGRMMTDKEIKAQHLEKYLKQKP